MSVTPTLANQRLARARGGPVRTIVLWIIVVIAVGWLGGPELRQALRR